MGLLTLGEPVTKSMVPAANGAGMVKERRLLGAPLIHVAQLKEDMAMRTAFDFSPLYRSSIGFDRVFDLLENASRVTTVDNWPTLRHSEDRR